MKSKTIQSDHNLVMRISGKFNRIKFAKMLRQKRIELGYSQKELGSYINRKNMQIQRYESLTAEEDLPPLELLVEICVLLQINPNDILNVTIGYEESVAPNEKIIENYEILKDRLYWMCSERKCGKKNVDYDFYEKMKEKDIVKKNFTCEHCSAFYDRINPDKLKQNTKFKTTIRGQK